MKKSHKKKDKYEKKTIVKKLKWKNLSDGSKNTLLGVFFLFYALGLCAYYNNGIAFVIGITFPYIFLRYFKIPYYKHYELKEVKK